MGYTADGYDVADDDPNCIISESRFQSEFTAWLDEQDAPTIQITYSMPKFDWGIGDVTPINPMGEEIISHIHHILKKDRPRGKLRENLFTIIEQICAGYFKTEGLLRLYHDLNIP